MLRANNFSGFFNPRTWLLVLLMAVPGVSYSLDAQYDALKLWSQAKAACTKGNFFLNRSDFPAAIDKYNEADSLYKMLIYVRRNAIEQYAASNLSGTAANKAEALAEPDAAKIDIAVLFKEIEQLKINKGSALIAAGELEKGKASFDTAAGIAVEMAPKWGTEPYKEVSVIKNAQIAALASYSSLAIEHANKVSSAHRAALILLLICVVWAGVSIYRRWKRMIAAKDAQAEEYLANAQALMEEASSAKAANSSLLNELDMQKVQERHLKELLDGRFAEIRSIAASYYELGFSKPLQKRLEALFESGRDGDIFESLKEVVNARRSNVLERIAEKFPLINEDNMRLLAMIYAGFSAQEISVIINDTAANVYVRKSRLKSKLADFMKENKDFVF